MDCRPEWGVEHAAVLGDREGVLKELIDEYKFAYKRSAAEELSLLLSVLLPSWMDAIVVPIPTIRKHIRERGFDHMALLARRVARLNRLQYAPLIVRLGQTIQHGATRRDRISQAENAFSVTSYIRPEVPYVIIDDITTTGASLRAATQVLRVAGARHVSTVALARQPLEETLDDRG